MRKLLILAVIAVLSLQSVVAVAARYCLHEIEQGAAVHFGHHEHQHVPSGVDGSDPAQQDAHPDCGFCQLSAAPCLQGQGAGIVADSATSSLTGPPPVRSPVLLDDPDRPPRARAA